MRKLLIAFLGGCVACCTGGCKEEYKSPVYEFVCQDEGRITEEQTHIIWADEYQTMWRIRYEDGHRAYYHQPEGETCFVTEVR